MRSIQDSDIQKEASKQRNEVLSITQRIFEQEGKFGGGVIIADSLRFINEKLQSTDKGDMRIAEVFRDIILQNIDSRFSVITDDRLVRIYDQAGYLPKSSSLQLEGAEKQYALFWDPNGGPRTWQIVSVGTQFGYCSWCNRCGMDFIFSTI